VQFRITPHHGFTSSTRPANSVDLLGQRLGESHGGASFARVSPDEITATWGEGPASTQRGYERAESGRRAVLEILRDVCDGAPELELDWYAVGFFE